MATTDKARSLKSNAIALAKEQAREVKNTVSSFEDLKSKIGKLSLAAYISFDENRILITEAGIIGSHLLNIPLSSMKIWNMNFGS